METIDRAIHLIKSTSLQVEVGPFGTAVEGPLREIESLISQLLRFEHQSQEFLLNVQFHVGDSRLSNEEKTKKHK